MDKTLREKVEDLTWDIALDDQTDDEVIEVIAKFVESEQLALINKIEELESMQDEPTTIEQEGWLVNRKLDRNRLRSELREALNKLKQEVL